MQLQQIRFATALPGAAAFTGLWVCGLLFGRVFIPPPYRPTPPFKGSDTGIPRKRPRRCRTRPPGSTSTKRTTNNNTSRGRRKKVSRCSSRRPLLLCLSPRRSLPASSLPSPCLFRCRLQGHGAAVGAQEVSHPVPPRYRAVPSKLQTPKLPQCNTAGLPLADFPMNNLTIGRTDMICRCITAASKGSYPIAPCSGLPDTLAVYPFLLAL